MWFYLGFSSLQSESYGNKPQFDEFYHQDNRLLNPMAEVLKFDQDIFYSDQTT